MSHLPEQQLTKQEQAQKAEKRRKLLARFPDGVAEIVAIWDKKKPSVETPTAMDYRKPRATSTPALPIYPRTGGTHPHSGLAEVKVRKIDIPIWPIPGRTDQAGDLTKFYKPIGVLELLADQAMGWGTIYNLRPVPKAELEAESKALTVPESKAAFDSMKRNFESNLSEEAGRNAPPKRSVVDLDSMTTGDEDVDPYDQLTDDEVSGVDESEPAHDDQAVLISIVNNEPV